MAKSRNAPKDRKQVTAPTFQAALDALADLDKDARRSGADELTVAQIDELIRKVRSQRRTPKGKTA